MYKQIKEKLQKAQSLSTIVLSIHAPKSCT